jgi:Pectate lyase superfamily protein
LALTTVTLTGTYVGGDSQPLAGQLVFVPSVPLTDMTNMIVLPQAQITVPLNSAGSFSVPLYSTDSGNLAPAGWTWQVTVAAGGVAPETWNFFLPYADGATQDISSLTPVAEVTPVSAYLPESGGTLSGTLVLDGSPALRIPGGGASGDVLMSDADGNASWQVPSATGDVASVFGRTGAVTAETGDYGVSEVTGAAPLASPVFTGVPEAPTAAALASDTQVATTAYADSAVGVEKTRAEAAEAALVALSGTQSIAGVKTFTGEIVVPTPVNPSDAATMAYVNATAQGLSVKTSVQEATTAALSPGYSFTSASGGTLTATTAGVLTVDGQSVALDDRVLVQDETGGNAPYNGIYLCTTQGTSGVAYVLTRSTDMDTGPQFPGAFTFVEKGTVNAGCGFVCTTPATVTLNTTNITWTQFSSAGTVTAGAGLTQAGDVLSLATPVTIADGGTGTGTDAPVNQVFAGPGSGSPGAPAFRGLVSADIPANAANTTGNAATATTASGLTSATTAVGVSAATAPAAGQALTAASPTAANWQYPPSDWFNVRNYGALGNGSDATSAISAAITACQAAGGGTVYIPEGIYSISSPLLAGGGSPGALVIRGSGWNSQLKLVNGANCYILDTGTPDPPTGPQYTPGLRVCDLYLNANAANQTGDSGCIYARGSCFGVFDHVWFDQPWNYGLRFYQDGLGNYGHHNRITACYFSNGDTAPSGGLGMALYFDNCDENSVLGCTFQNNGNGTYPACQVYDHAAGRQTFSGCTFVTTATPASSVSGIKTDSNPSGCTITGCQFDSNTTGNLLEINGPDCVVTGCQFLSFGVNSGSNAAIHLSSTYTQVTGNSFTPTGTKGIAVLESGTANTGTGTSGVGFNVIAGAGLSADTYYDAAPVVLVPGDSSVWVTYPLPVADGGTGLTSLTGYELLAANPAGTAITQVGAGTAGQVLTSNGSGAAPAMQGLPAATTGAEGVIQLAGDLGGTAASPEILKIQGTAISAPPGGTAEFLAGNGTWQTPAGGGGGGSSTLAGDSDVDIASPVSGQTLVYNNGGTRQWQNVPREFNVMAFGATGNGTTNDYTAIAAALTAAAGGGTVYFPPGTYLVSSPLTMTSGITILGAGREASVLKGSAAFPYSAPGGVIQFGTSTYTSSGPTISGCQIRGIGFNMTAVNDATVNQVNAIFQDYSLVTDLLIENIWYSGQTMGCCIMLNGLARGKSAVQWAHGITIRDVYALNGAGTVCCYPNANIAGTSTVSGIDISGIYNYVTVTGIADDRVVISATSHESSTVSYVRDVTVRDVFVDVASGSSGTVNGVKLDAGSYGQIQNVLISGVHYFAQTSGSATGYPVIMYSTGLTTGGAAAQGWLQDWAVENVYAQNSYGLTLFLNRFAAAPQCVVRNVVMENCQDGQYLVQLSTASAAQGDESVIFDSISGSSATEYLPFGIQLCIPAASLDGTSSMGASGLVLAKGLMFRAATPLACGISSTENQANTGTQANSYSNVIVRDSNLSGCTAPISLAGTCTIRNVVGLNDYPAVPDYLSYSLAGGV